MSYEAEFYEDALEDAIFLAEHEGDEESKLFIADCMIQLERYEEAEKTLLRFSEFAGKSIPYHLLFGLLKTNTGREEEAIEEFRKIFSIETTFEDAWVFRMVARFFIAGNFILMGKTDLARKEARLAAREAREPEPFFESLNALESDITPELLDALEDMRLLAEEEEEEILSDMLRRDKENL